MRLVSLVSERLPPNMRLKLAGRAGPAAKPTIWNTALSMRGRTASGPDVSDTQFLRRDHQREI